MSPDIGLVKIKNVWEVFLLEFKIKMANQNLIETA